MTSVFLPICVVPTAGAYASCESSVQPGGAALLRICRTYQCCSAGSLSRQVNTGCRTSCTIGVLAICAQLHGGIVMVDEPLNWHRTNLASACHEELKQAGKKMDARPTYQPYLYGIANYRRLQQQPNWQMLYTYIYEHTREPKFALAHRMSYYMLHHNLLALFCLCFLCLKHGDKIYYSKHQRGLMAKIRAFCYPLIFSYNNIQYNRQS